MFRLVQTRLLETGFANYTHSEFEKERLSLKIEMTLMIRRWSAKALRYVQPRRLETGTPRNTLLHSPNELLSCCERDFSGFSDRSLSYREKLRSGLVEIKADDAVSLFQDMLQSRPRPTLIDFSRLFSAVARTKQYHLVLDLCKQMELNGIAQDLFILSIMINCFCRCRKLCLAFSTMGKIMKLGYEPDTVTFTTLLNGLCLEGRVSEAVELVDRMVKMELRPNLITTNTLVNGLCLKGHVSEALVFIDRMVEYGCQPDVVTYGPVLNVMCKSGKTALAMDLLRKMEERTIKLDAVHYSIIIDGLCKNGNLDDALNLFNEMEMKGIAPDTITHSSLIDGLCKLNRLDEANQMLDLMVSKGCDPNIVTFSILINGYCKANRIDDGLELFRKIPLRGMVADTITYNTLIQGFCQSGKLEVAKELFQEMVSRGVHPNIVTCKILLDGLCDNGFVPNGILMQSLGGNPTQAQLKSIIASGNLSSPFDFNGFLDLIVKYLKTEPFDRQLRDAAKVLDKEGTGFVAVADLWQILASIRGKLEPNEFDEWIKEVDVGFDEKSGMEIS